MPTQRVSHEYMTIDRFNDDPTFADRFYGRLREVVIVAAQLPPHQLHFGLAGPIYDTLNDIVEGECEQVSMQQADALHEALRELIQNPVPHD